HYEGFSCGDDPYCVKLNNFLIYGTAKKAHKRGESTTYVVEDDSKKILGYITYTLRPIALPNGEYPGAEIFKFAVDQPFQGTTGYGRILMWEAFRQVAKHVQDGDRVEFVILYARPAPEVIA